MKLFVSADIEGVAGVVSPLQGQAGNVEYERARRLMTEEVNAAIDGAFAGGATEVLVNDSHGPMTNLLPDLLDTRAELISGRPKPQGMFCGLERGHGGVFCLGYHAGAGGFGVLSHTTNSFAFANVTLNGIACNEAILYGAYAGELGVPVLLLSGCDQLAAECAPHFPAAARVVVKRALGQRAARSVHPQRARQMLRAAAEDAVSRAKACAPFVVPRPCRLVLDLTFVALADLAATIPVAERTGPRTVAFTAEGVAAALGWVNTVSALSALLR